LADFLVIDENDKPPPKVKIIYEKKESLFLDCQL